MDLGFISGRRALGRQRVVVAFTALALAAEDNGRGQKEERGRHQQEEAEPGKDPHNLQGESGQNEPPSL